MSTATVLMALIIGVLATLLGVGILVVLRARSGREWEALGRMSADLSERMREFESHLLRDSREFQALVRDELERLRTENGQQLEKMRETVGQKLQETLETRLAGSFRTVSEHLERVNSGLGEMRELARGVGDLKRVLAGPSTKGRFGEVQLENVLQEFLAQEQYEKNVATIPGSAERVEFAVKLPGHGSGAVMLPIDAKFPTEDYERLLEAYASADAPGVAAGTRALRQRVLVEAEKIRKKYVAPPHTTQVALMFLPSEGLYAEVLRIRGIFDELHALQIIPVGPSTLYAVLNSLQMGFRTLALQQRSEEIGKTLGAVKTEFQKFGNALVDVKTKLRQASEKIEATEVRTRVMERALRQVEGLEESEAERRLAPDQTAS